MRSAHDGMTQRERMSLETYRDARAALALIREAIEDCAPPGSVVREGVAQPGIHRRSRGTGPRHLRNRGGTGEKAPPAIGAIGASRPPDAYHYGCRPSTAHRRPPRRTAPFATWNFA